MGLLPALMLFAFLQQADPSDEGIKALEEKRYEAAVAAFERAIAAQPDDYGAHFHLAFSLSMLDRNAEAIPAYRKVLELKPGLYEAELNLGILLLGAKQPAEAAGLLEAAAARKPVEFRPRFYLAEALLESGRAAEAEPAYRKAIEIDPKSAASAAGLARALLKQDRLADAEAAFREAARLDPAERPALLELAGLYEQRKLYAQAAAIYREFRDQPGVEERLGALLLESGKAQDSIASLEAAVKTSPSAANRYALATAYIRVNQKEKAAAMLEQAVALEPQDHALRMTYGRTLRDLRRFPDAARQFWQVTQAQPDSKDAWSELAGVLLLMENHTQALAAFQRLEALGETGAALYYFRAISLDRLKQFQPALAAYEKFLSLSEGRHPDEEFKARQRVRILRKELSRR